MHSPWLDSQTADGATDFKDLQCCSVITKQHSHIKLYQHHSSLNKNYNEKVNANLIKKHQKTSINPQNQKINVNSNPLTKSHGRWPPGTSRVPGTHQLQPGPSIRNCAQLPGRPPGQAEGLVKPRKKLRVTLRPVSQDVCCLFLWQKIKNDANTCKKL